MVIIHVSVTFYFLLINLIALLNFLHFIGSFSFNILQCISLVHKPSKLRQVPSAGFACSCSRYSRLSRRWRCCCQLLISSFSDPKRPRARGPLPQGPLPEPERETNLVPTSCYYKLMWFKRTRRVKLSRKTLNHLK